MNGALPAALLAEPLLLVADDHHRRLGVRLADLVPAVVLAAPTEVGPAPVDGARVRDAAPAHPAGPPPRPGRPRRPRAPDETDGEILVLYLCGWGGGVERPCKGYHGRSPVRRRAPGRRLGCHRPLHIAVLFTTKKPSIIQRRKFRCKLFMASTKKSSESRDFCWTLALRAQQELLMAWRLLQAAIQVQLYHKKRLGERNVRLEEDEGGHEEDEDTRRADGLVGSEQCGCVVACARDTDSSRRPRWSG
jgi:hypothetical protein